MRDSAGIALQAKLRHSDAKWEDDDNFMWAVAYIRREGYRQKFGKTRYTQLDDAGHTYWTMGCPISTLCVARAPIATNHRARNGDTPQMRPPLAWSAIAP